MCSGNSLKQSAALLLLVALAVACAPGPLATHASPPTSTEKAEPRIDNGLAPGEGISEIHMFDAQRGWAWATDLGANSRLMSTYDGGSTWADRSPAATAYGQQGASFLDADHAWLPTFDSGSNDAGLVYTSDGGKKWSPGAAAAGPYTGYKFASVKDGVASTADVGAGNAYVRFYQTQDGGTSWSLVPVQSPTPETLQEGTIHICNICGDTASLFLPNTVIITHGDLAGDPQGAARLTVTMDLGKTWSELKLVLPSVTYDGSAVAPRSPIFFDEQHGVMLVHIFKTQDFSNYAYRVLALYSTNDGGRTWTPGGAVAEDVQTFESAIDVLSMTDVIVRCGSHLCATHDAGQAWMTATPDIDFGAFGTDHQLAQIDFISRTTGWAVLNEDDVFKLYKTTDGGHTWNLLSK